MSFFFLRFVFFFALFIFLAKVEFSARKKRNLKPQKIKELFSMGAKWEKKANPKQTALFFAISSFVAFSIWEAFILSSLGIFMYFNVLTFILGITAWAIFLKKRSSFGPWGYKETLYLSFSMGAVAGAAFCWLMFPWVYFRSLYLRSN